MGRSRRWWMLAWVLVAWGLTSSAEGQRLRIMAANISSGNFQSYPNPGPGTRIFQALDPDVVLIQEFNVNATSGADNDADAVDAWVDDVFGTDFHWFREPGGDSIPNGVISRWPIVQSGEWRDSEVSDRDFAWARIDIPGDADLWVVSVHLLTRSSGVRSAEAGLLLEAIRNHPVPEEDFLVIGGDFNTDARNEPALAILGAVVDTLGPFPNDGGDPPDEDTNASRRKPYDWVLADAELTSFEVAVEVGEFRFPDGLVFDSRIFSQQELDDSFPPVERSDSGAPQMQHMAVVRDFLLGEEPGPDFRIPFAGVAFGTASALGSPRVDSSLRIEVVHPFDLTAIAFAGSHPEEFALVSPDLGQGPVSVTADTSLVFAWRPEIDDGLPRDVTATLITDGEPGAVEIRLRGTAAAPVVVPDEPGEPEEPGEPDTPSPQGGAEPIDLGGYRLLQSGGEAVLTFPAGTVLAPGGVLVIGRAAGRAEFEAFWGPLPAAALYLNGGALAGDPGFPVINGGERFRLVDATGAAVDPATGQLPGAPLVEGRVYQRTTTGGELFDLRTDPRGQATPGRYAGSVAGTAAGTGHPVITEISDATGPGGFVFEFVEIFYDAGPVP